MSFHIFILNRNDLVISVWVASQVLTPRASSCSIGFIVKCLDLGSLHTLILSTTSQYHNLPPASYLHSTYIQMTILSFQIILDKFTDLSVDWCQVTEDQESSQLTETSKPRVSKRGKFQVRSIPLMNSWQLE